MIKAVVVGYGNVGKYAIEAVKAAGDMELLAVIRRNPEEKEIMGVKVVADVTELDEKPDVAILCTP
ncbi:MAG: Gfo/Idh/MocA family oxidoreductase, partial [Oscillospiraceae bacterium]|nr:Gfo/Idh/MocA family oxidoreductase [Oscillospiraceae bacterium]